MGGMTGEALLNSGTRQEAGMAHRIRARSPSTLGNTVVVHGRVKHVDLETQAAAERIAQVVRNARRHRQVQD